MRLEHFSASSKLNERRDMYRNAKFEMVMAEDTGIQ